MKRCPPWRQTSPLFSFAILLLLLSAPGGCEESKTCPTQPDLAVSRPDLAPPAVDTTPLPKPDVNSACQQDKVQCKTDEINAFGICLASSSMITIPAGEFTRGKNEDGKPYHPEQKITLKEFLIDVTEVTVGQYQACVDCGTCPPPLRDGSHTGREPYYGNEAYKNYPVIFVRWTDAKTYCEGIGKRLPTEAEWERAARGTDGREYPWGSSKPSPTMANFASTINDTKPVTDYESGKSPAGVLNLAGNVWEWVADTYDADYYSTSPTADPPGPSTGSIKVMRGGGFTSSVEQLKTYGRTGEAESSAYSHLGFRCATGKW